jgi:quinol monooxygenase YgiN
MQVTRVFVLSCALALSALGCGGNKSTAPSEPEAAAGAETATAAPAPAEAPLPAPAPAAAPAPAPAAAPVAAAPEPQMPPLGAVVTHKVKDFAAWKTSFDGHEQGRKDAGIVAHAVMKDVKKPNSVSVWVAYADQAKVDAMMGSDDMKAKMKEGGVVGKPAVVAMKNAFMSPPGGDKQPKFGAMIVHEVKDFAAWKTAFESHDQVRKDAGIIGYAVSQDPKDPNKVIVWLEADDQAKLEGFLKNKDLKAKMKEAGVKGAPTITVYEIVEFKMGS